jgi:uncharacterized membrane protein YfcA
VNFLLIGLIVGGALGLTGGGGAIIGIPLLVHLGGLSINRASVLALPIVAISSCVSLIWQRRFIDLSVVLKIVLAGIPATIGMAFVKPYIPIWVIQGALVLIAVWGLYTVWFVSSISGKRPRPRAGMEWGIGFLSGVMTSLTGLGGGLLLLPLLRRFMGVEDKVATATSLSIIVVNALVSFAIQSRVLGWGGVDGYDIGFLVLGFMMANGGIHALRIWCSKECHRQLVRVIYSGVLVTAIGLLVLA